jgi:hypothetical protein
MAEKHSNQKGPFADTAIGNDGITSDHVAIAAADLSVEDRRAIREARYPEGHENLNALMDDD